MSSFLKGFSSLSTRVIYSIFGVFALVLIYHYFFPGEEIEHYEPLTRYLLLLCLIGPILIRIMIAMLERVSEKAFLFIFLILCFGIKIAFVLNYRIEPEVDYATFYDVAVSLTENFVINNRYVALFPHILGYSSFLSIFFFLFGAHEIIPPLVNVVLSTISMGLIYYIGKKTGGVRVGIIASVLWIFFPSQTMYNIYALSEPLYSTILLLIWAVMIKIHEKLNHIHIRNLLFYSILLGLLLVLMNMARPIAAIPIIALVIWLFIINTEHLGNKGIMIKKVIYIMAVILSYSILSSIANYYTEVRVGEELGTFPGYNIHVGFNMNTYGAYNMDDASLLSYYDAQKDLSANDVQKLMFEEAKQRIQSGEINFLKLFYEKFLIFLGDDAGAVSYAQTILDDTAPYEIISNVYYYFVLAASFLGVLFAFIKNDKSALLYICLFAIGLTMAQMLVEVAPRYHYSATLSMIILASIGINGLFKKKKE